MVKRTHHTLLWLFAIFVAYLIVVRALITWAQWAPDQFSSTVAYFTDTAIEFQDLNIEQNWAGVTLKAGRLEVGHEQFEFSVQQLAVDLNLFSTLLPQTSWGAFLEAKQVTLLEFSPPAAASQSESASFASQALFSAEHLAGEVDISRLWKRVSIDQVLLSTYREGRPLKVSVNHFQAFKGAHWSMAADLGVTYGQVLQDEPFQFKASFLPSVWGRIQQGNLSLSSFKPLRIENLATLLPAKWQEVLPAGELNLEVNGEVSHGLVSDLNLELYAQAMRWPDRKALLPKTLGVNLEWQNQEQVRDQQGINWRFSANQVQMDNRFIQTVAPVELYLTSDRYLHFSTRKFDIRPFKKMVHSILRNENLADLFGASVTLALEDIEGKLDIETLVLEDLSLEIDSLAVPVTHLPGLAMEQVYVDKRGTDFQLIIDKPFWLMDPRVHPVPMRFDVQGRMNGKIYALQHAWRLEPLKLLWDQMPLDIAGRGDFQGELDATLSIAPGRIEKVKQYLPYPIMSDKLRAWLKAALISGQNVKGDFFFKGNLNDYPFETGETTFGGQATVSDVNLKFQPDWPALKGFDAQLAFSPYKLEIRSDQVALQNALKAYSVKVVIDHLNQKDIAVVASGRAVGEAKDAIDYLLNTPLPAKVGLDELLSDSSKVDLKGPLKVDLEEIWIPVGGYHDLDERVKGGVVMSDSELTLYEAFTFDQLDGRLSFTERSLTGDKIKGRFEQGEMGFSVRTGAKNDQIEVQAKGQAVSTYESLLKGAIPWQGKILIPLDRNAESKVSVQGQADTSAAEWNIPLPFSESKPGQFVQMDLVVGEVDTRLSGIVDRLGSFKARLKEGSWQPGALSGVVQFGEAKEIMRQMPENQVVFQGRLPVLDLDKWTHWKAPDFESDRASGPGVGDWASAIQWGDSNLAFDQLLLWEETYGPLQLNWQTSQKDWIDLKAKSDYADMVARLYKQESLDVQVNQLHLRYADEKVEPETSSKTVQETVDNCKAETPSPGNWPKVEFVGKNIRINGIRVDAARFQLEENRDVLHFKDLSARFARGAGVLTGEYFFHKQAKQSSARLMVESDNVESLTQLVGLKRGFSGEHAQIKSNIAWPGGAECFSLYALTGRTRFEAKDGVLEDVEPGFARLLGLLNVTSLARRLSLNLDDVTTKGMAYDKVEGESIFKQGKMVLDGFELKAPSASLKLKGNVDMIRRRFNLKAEVTPALGSSLPALSAITGVASPLTALAVYALMKVLPDINEELVTYKYDVTGPWDKPEIESRNGQPSGQEVNDHVDELLNGD